MQRKTLFIIIGAIAGVLIVIGIALAVFWPTLTSANNSANTSGTPTVSTTTTPTAKNANTNKILKQYAPAIKTQIAQGLNMTPEQLTAQLRAGKTLSQIATAQNISATQLQTIISNALTTALTPAVGNGDLTQAQVNKLSKRLESNQTTLDHLLGAKATPKTGTPTTTPTPAQ